MFNPVVILIGDNGGVLGKIFFFFACLLVCLFVFFLVLLAG